MFQSKGRLTAYGFEVEIAIPFKTLRFPADAVQSWALNVIRRVQSSGVEDSWTPAERAKSSFAVNVRAVDAIHVAPAEVLVAEAQGEPLEFWTHDDRQGTAALSRGLTVRGV